jgi:glycosyltransferase involved in cell wall biosynthesis
MSGLRYSICITHFNNVRTVKRSLESILGQIDSEFEVIVVDSMSNDGSEKILDEYFRKNLIRLVRKRCNRGKGRQIAFENSTGEYIIANIDMDDVLQPRLRSLLMHYHSKCEGKLLLAVSGTDRATRGLQNITIGPRSLINRLGGWRDLQFCEDWDIWCRAAELGSYAWTRYAIAKSEDNHLERERPLIKFRNRYIRYRDFLRLGRRLFDDGENITPAQRTSLVLANVGALFSTKYKSDFGRRFDPYQNNYFVEFDSLRQDTEAIEKL